MQGIDDVAHGAHRLEGLGLQPLAGQRLELHHVPYRGAGQQLQDLLGGNIEFSVSVLSSALPHIESGKMVPLGVTTPTRSRAAPQIPALAENPKLKGYDMVSLTP